MENIYISCSNAEPPSPSLIHLLKRALLFVLFVPPHPPWGHRLSPIHSVLPNMLLNPHRQSHARSVYYGIHLVDNIPAAEQHEAVGKRGNVDGGGGVPRTTRRSLPPPLLGAVWWYWVGGILTGTSIRTVVHRPPLKQRSSGSSSSSGRSGSSGSSGRSSMSRSIQPSLHRPFGWPYDTQFTAVSCRPLSVQVVDR